MSPSLELQQAIVPDLKAQSGIAALVGNRIYDNAPEGCAFPYVSWGRETSQNDDAQCIIGSEIAVQLDVWSRTPSSAECRRIVDAIKRRMEVAEYTLAVNAVAGAGYVERTDVFRDTDGRTWHGVIIVIYSVEQV